VAAIVSSYVVYYSLFSVWRFFSFGLSFDWCVLADSIFNASQGRGVINEFSDGSFLKEHISSAFLFYIPFFKMHPLVGSLAMLLSQVLSMGIAGWLLYLLAARWLKSNVLGLLVIILFFSNWRLQKAVLHDYHMLTLVPGFLLLAYWGAIRGRRFWMWCGFVGCLILREDAFLALLGLPLYLAWSRRRWCSAIAMLVLIVLYAVALFEYVFPAIRGGVYAYVARDYGWLADTMGGLIRRCVTEPHVVAEKLLTERDNRGLFLFLSEYGFLALFSVSGWLTSMFSMSLSLLSNASHLCGYGLHYVVPPSSTLMIGSVLSIRYWRIRFRRHRVLRHAAIWMLVVLIVYNISVSFKRGTQPNSVFFQRACHVAHRDWKRIRAAHVLVASLPSDAKVSISMNLFSRYFSIDGVELFRGRAGVREHISHLLLDKRCRQGVVGATVTPGVVRRLCDSGEWTLIEERVGICILKRNGAN